MTTALPAPWASLTTSGYRRDSGKARPTTRASLAGQPPRRPACAQRPSPGQPPGRSCLAAHAAPVLSLGGGRARRCSGPFSRKCGARRARIFPLALCGWRSRFPAEPSPVSGQADQAPRTGLSRRTGSVSPQHRPATWYQLRQLSRLGIGCDHFNVRFGGICDPVTDTKSRRRTLILALLAVISGGGAVPRAERFCWRGEGPGGGRGLAAGGAWRREGLAAEGLAAGRAGGGKGWRREGLAAGRAGGGKGWRREGLAAGRAGGGKGWRREGLAAGGEGGGRRRWREEKVAGRGDRRRVGAGSLPSGLGAGHGARPGCDCWSRLVRLFAARPSARGTAFGVIRTRS